MTPPQGSQPAPYELRAPTSGMGMLDPRSALIIWGAGSILLGATISMLMFRGEFRMILLLLLGVLGLACLTPKRGVYILTISLPFVYFLRRLVLNFEEFDRRDPILMFPVLTAVGMFLGLIIFYRPLVFHYLRHSAILKACLCLMAWFVAMVFNPRQGSPLVGMAGATYFIIPMTWCAFGLLMTRDDLKRILKIVVLIGCITSLYGLYQHYFGLSAVELYELKSKDFLKAFGQGNVRIMSTFSSLGDFSLYLSVAGSVTFAFFWESKRNLSLLLVLMLNLYTMLFTAVRASFFVLFFNITVLLILHGRNPRAMLARGLVGLLLCAAAYGTLYSYDPQSLYGHQFSTNPYVVHTISGVTHPTKEATFQGRLGAWSRIVATALTEYPMGRGLGSTTPAASKFSDIKSFDADSYFFELFYGSGLVAPVLFVVLVYLYCRCGFRLCVSEPGDHLYKVCLALMCGIYLGSFFGQSIRDMIMGPLAWLITGWTIRESVDREKGLPAVRMALPAQGGRF